MLGDKVEVPRPGPLRAFSRHWAGSKWARADDGGQRSKNQFRKIGLLKTHDRMRASSVSTGHRRPEKTGWELKLRKYQPPAYTPPSDITKLHHADVEVGGLWIMLWCGGASGLQSDGKEARCVYVVFSFFFPDMRKIYERAVKGRLFGLRALQHKAGRVGGPVEAVADCWNGYCRVCLGSLLRGQAIHIPNIGGIWPCHGQDGPILSCSFEQAFLRRCEVTQARTSLPIQLHQGRSQGTHLVSNAEVPNSPHLLLDTN